MTSRYEGYPKSHRFKNKAVERHVTLLNYMDQVNLHRIGLPEMREIADEMSRSIEDKIKRGLSYPTFLHPTSAETIKNVKDGRNITIEVGGTNMRGTVWEAKNGHIAPVEKPLGGKLKKNDKVTTKFDSTDDFFDSLFASMPELIDIIKKNPNAPLSVIFSFEGRPVETEDGLDYVVTRLSKGFEIPGMLNNSFISLLNTYLKKRHDIEKRKVALFNDTAILVMDNVGLVVGTGYNYAIKMPVDKLRNILGQDYAGDWSANEQMVINIEAAEMGIIKKYAGPDNSRSLFSRIDRSSEKPGKATDEKLISGKYLGEALKLLLSDINELTRGRAIVGLNENTVIKPEHLTMILEDFWRSISSESEFVEKYTGTKPIDEVLLPFDVNINYRSVIKEACEIIRDRAAYFVASMLVGGIEATGDNHISALVEGSVFWRMPGFKEKVEEGIKLLKGNDFSIKMLKNPEGFDEIGDSSPFGSQYYGALSGFQYFIDREKREELKLI